MAPAVQALVWVWPHLLRRLHLLRRGPSHWHLFWAAIRVLMPVLNYATNTELTTVTRAPTALPRPAPTPKLNGSVC